MFIYFEIHVQCIRLIMSNIIKLLTHFMLTVKHSALTNHSLYDFCQFYLLHNICLFLKLLVSRISSYLNVISIIFYWLNLFLLRMFKCCLFMIIVSVYCFCVCLSILLKSIMSVCILKNCVHFLLSFSFMQRFPVFFVLMKSWSKIKSL